MLQPKERLIIALDVDTAEQALAHAEKLKEHAGVFKIGMQLYNSEGPEMVRRMNALGAKLFVDLKFHDIPNTVAAASRVMARLGCSMFNVHAAGGKEMMKQAAEASRDEAAKAGLPAPRVLAVTVLTSLAEQQVAQEMHSRLPLKDLVVEWAVMAKEAGIDGVVASPQEIAAIRTACGPDFLIVTPGVRPAWADANDQKRVMTPREALDQGADYMVIGRPVLKAADPVAAAGRIIQELEG
ncbi:MAG: orotidine-5'-phosphate decarboxylase [Solirubrobacterales bacterium]